jgi:sugar lactone lactonase YvrE
MAELSVLADGFTFTEGPRWHDGQLWFSDMHAHTVYRATPDGKVEAVVEVAGKPSGLGWLPDGRLLVVSMEDRRLMRLDAGLQLVEVADISGIATWHCNDMVVDGAGRAYIGNFGFDMWARDATVRPASLARVDPDGTVSTAATELQFPNGMVITPDGGTLIVGESYGGCLTAFDVAPDGSLSGRRTWAVLSGATPDGICLDAEGAIWLASPVGHEVLRVRAGGQEVERVTVGEDRRAVACMLGGPDRRTLFVCTTQAIVPEKAVKLRSARIEMIEVAVPGAGLP